PHRRAVLALAVLGEAVQRAVGGDRTSARPADAAVASHPRTGRMLAPRAARLVRAPEAELVVLLPPGAGEHPPCALVREERGIDGDDVVQQHGVERPLVRPARRAIEPD